MQTVTLRLSEEETARVAKIKDTHCLATWAKAVLHAVNRYTDLSINNALLESRVAKLERKIRDLEKTIEILR